MKAESRIAVGLMFGAGCALLLAFGFAPVTPFQQWALTIACCVLLVPGAIVGAGWAAMHAPREGER